MNQDQYTTKKIKFKKPTRKVVVIVSLCILVLFFSIWLINNSRSVRTKNTSSNQKTQIPEAIKTLSLNKEYTYPLKDRAGKEVSRFKFVIENAELRDQIIVKGQRASSIQGRTFLVLNLKLTNEYDKAVSINTRDYIRLIVNNNENELLAADVHNDPVEVQAISTKNTRLAFPINDNNQSLKLRVGEINGEKTTLDLPF